MKKQISIETRLLIDDIPTAASANVNVNMSLIIPINVFHFFQLSKGDLRSSFVTDPTLIRRAFSNGKDKKDGLCCRFSMLLQIIMTRKIHSFARPLFYSFIDLFIYSCSYFFYAAYLYHTFKLN